MEEQHVECLETEVGSQATRQERIFKEMQEMFSALNASLVQISRTSDGSSSAFNGGGGRTFGSGSTTPNSGNFYLPKMVKLDFPHFNGLEDPTSWVCCAEQFFEFHHTLEKERVPLASFNLEGDAQLRFQLMKEETPITTWATFKQALHDRRSVSCKHYAAIGLARLYESCNQTNRRYSLSDVKQPFTNIVTKFDRRQNFMPIKWLSPAELKEQRDKGLCFNCDEKFSLGHRCKKLFLVEGCSPDVEDEAEGECSAKVDLVGEELPEVSIDAIYGARTPQTIRVHGNVGKYQMTFLVGSGSTHNFLSSKIARKAGINPTSFGKLEVSVANGEKLASDGLCKGVCILVQGVPIIVGMYLLPLEGCDAVLEA
ncbi:unnamed protein product [Prunus armeniaca]|uniref:Retrotransposon gag domain-containing protein n=1 Tax=Prunus armeniaca TaxID=36596 RepID=A0A6J5WUZ3_PRUAR|nr:unnamed protein product [Prunus armeniaca]